jgi:C4-dicarboxylate transporter DctM subunit
MAWERSGMMIWIIACITAVMLFAGFEMFLVLGVPGYLVSIVYFGTLPETVLIQKMVGGINHNILLAIPFFLFAAEMMSGGRLAGLLGNAAQACFRRVRGGPGYAAVVGNMAFSAVSGSAPATVAALGRIMYQPLVRAGFRNNFSLGLIVSAAETALLIPPSISLIIYGWLTETSISRLFAAGLVIGIVLGLAFAAFVWLEVRRHGITADETFGNDASKQVVKGTIWALGMPIVILGGIYSGVFTATEAAAVSVVYAAFVEAVIFRTLSLRKFFWIAQRTAVMTSVIFMLLALGSVIAYFVILAELPQLVMDLLKTVGAGPLLFLLIVNIVFLIAGMFIDPGTAQVILVPVLFPVAMAFGIDPVHFGMVVGLNVCIAMITPPFGLDIFVAASTLNKPVIEIIRGVGPFVTVNILVLAVITYVPGLATFLPNLLMGAG